MIHFYNMEKLSKDLVAHLHLYGSQLATDHSLSCPYYFSYVEAQGM